jgi:glyoxylate/hydroxypyruvate reductase A
MALLIEIGQPEWMANGELCDQLRPLLPGADIRCGPELGDPADIAMLVCSRLLPDLPTRLPNLRLVQKLGAGVETIVASPNLGPEVRVARLKPDAPAQEIAEYCLAYVLREQRNMAFHADRQRAHAWDVLAPRETPATTVGVLGLGHIGGRVATALAGLGFRVLGWSRSAKTLPGVGCRHGAAALLPMLGECDYVASVLPSTPETRDLADARFLAAMKPGAVLINVGRGDLVAEDDLLTALDSGHLGGAVLDVFRTEPLPAGHSFWNHPKVTVTPHVSGWRVTGAAATVAENYRRLMAGAALLNEIDRTAGY